MAKKKPPTIKSLEVVWLTCWYPSHRKLNSWKRPAWCRKYNKKMKPCVYCLDVPEGTKCPYLSVTSWPKREVRHAKDAIKERFKGDILFSKKEVEMEKKIVRMKQE